MVKSVDFELHADTPDTVTVPDFLLGDDTQAVDILARPAAARLQQEQPQVCLDLIARWVGAGGQYGRVG